MLAYLTVRNFALVADLELHFVDGLTVITGESGAGKSILLASSRSACLKDTNSSGFPRVRSLRGI